MLATIHEDIIDNSVFEELKSINPNILKSFLIDEMNSYIEFNQELKGLPFNFICYKTAIDVNYVKRFLIVRNCS